MKKTLKTTAKMTLHKHLSTVSVTKHLCGVISVSYTHLTLPTTPYV